MVATVAEVSSSASREAFGLGREGGDDGSFRRQESRFRGWVTEDGSSGFPLEVNHQAVAVLREEWRVVDRWWTEEPVVRRYFELVLETGENTVVFHDGAGGGWFTQRGA